jgi:hypothetical protein
MSRDSLNLQQLEASLYCAIMPCAKSLVSPPMHSKGWRPLRPTDSRECGRLEITHQRPSYAVESFRLTAFGVFFSPQAASTAAAWAVRRVDTSRPRGVEV